MPPLWAYLLFMVAASLAIREGCLVWIACLLFADWAVLHGYYLMTGDQFNWLVNFAVDYVCAVLVAVNCSGKGQVTVAAMFLPMLLAHLAYGNSNQGEWAQYRYWWAMFYMACIQAALMTFAILQGGVKAARQRRAARLGASLGPSPVGAVSVAKECR